MNLVYYSFMSISQVLMVVLKMMIELDDKNVYKCTQIY